MSSSDSNNYKKIGYYFSEFLRHGNQYGDLDELIKNLPFPLSKKAKDILHSKEDKSS